MMSWMEARRSVCCSSDMDVLRVGPEGAVVVVAVALSRSAMEPLAAEGTSRGLLLLMVCFVF